MPDDDNRTRFAWVFALLLLVEMGELPASGLDKPSNHLARAPLVSASGGRLTVFCAVIDSAVRVFGLAELTIIATLSSTD